MEAFDNGFRTGPYRKVRPGPEPVIERYRGPGIRTVPDTVLRPLPRLETRAPQPLPQLPGTTPGTCWTCWTSRAPRGADVVQDQACTDSGGGAGEEEDAHAVKNHGAQWKQVTATDSWACLMSNLAREGLQVRANVASDGNCQFAAITDHLERVRGTTVSHQQLRDRVVQYLTDNPTLGANWDEYLLRLSRPGVWGDEFILQAIANMEDVCIQMVSDLAGSGRTTRRCHRHRGQATAQTRDQGPTTAGDDAWDLLDQPGPSRG
ncbi:hypothetical protein Bbelb_166490 [Branchiostoma belcheri]|nr:hypothetical protein Bbelb_166490 [Branchiostoma belcheri]